MRGGRVPLCAPSYSIPTHFPPFPLRQRMLYAMPTPWRLCMATLRGAPRQSLPG